MDLKQAALFYKNRWKWRKDVVEHQERQAAAADRVKAQKAKTKSASQQVAEEDTGVEDTTVNKNKPADKRPKFKVGAKREERLSEKAEKRLKEQQELAVGFVRQTLDAVHGLNDPSAVKITDAALTLLRQPEVSAQDLLDFSKTVKKADVASPRIKAAIDKHKETFSDRQKTLWEEVLVEIKELEAKERKGDPVEFSAKFADDTLSVMDLFLGPAGPLAKVGRDFLAEHKEDAKRLAKGANRLSRAIAARVPFVKTMGRRASVLFERFLPNIKSNLRKLAERLKNSSGGGLLGAIGGAGGKALKIGQVIAGSELAQGALLLGGVASMVAANAAKSWAGEKMDSAKSWVGEKAKAVKNSGVVKLALAVTDGIVKFFNDATTYLANGSLVLGRRLGSFGKTQWDNLCQELESIKATCIKIWDSTDSPVKTFLTNLQNAIEHLWSWVKSFMPSIKKDGGASQGEMGYDANGNATGVLTETSPVAGAKGDGTPNPKEVKDLVTGVIDHTAVKFHGGATLEGANPGMVRNFMGMASEYKRITGKTIQLNDGKRSNSEQAALHAKYPNKAAPPGQSMHEYGLAVDINSADADALTRLGLMDKYGFTRPVAGEKWHVEPVAIQSMKASIRKNGAVTELATAETKPKGVESETDAKPADKVSVAAAAVSSQPMDTKSNSAAAPTKPGIASNTINSVKAPSVDKGYTVDTATNTTGLAPATSSGFARSSPMATVQAPTAASYERKTSYSRTVEQTIDTAENSKTPAKQQVTQKDGSNVPFYVGDLGLLTFNLGVV